MKNNTINKKEIEKFSRIAEEWWDPAGKFKPLHKFNPVRISYIKNSIINGLKLKNKKKPLEKIKILDIGCGGGLISEPMKRLGAEVVGIDASNKNIKVAKLHAKEIGLDIKYIHSSPENINLENEFDVILSMEVVEHVSDVNLFIEKCSKLIKKDGIIFISTINKNLKSYAFAILGAEYILRWLPIGTHDWNKFLTPKDLENITIKNNLRLDETVGIKYNVFFKKWSISKDTSVNYISAFLKN